MSQTIQGLEDKEKEVSGFYYDMQKSNPMQRITLHANTKPPEEDYRTWPAWSSATCNSAFPLKNETDLDPDTGSEKFKYGAMPICSSILQEDFNVSIANTWGDFIGGQQLESMWSGIKSFEPYLNFGAENLSKIGKGISTYIKNTPNSVFSGINPDNVDKFFNKASDVVDHIGSVASRQLVVQGTRFKYYSGTGIAFSNLGMRFTLFADHVPQLAFDKSKNLLKINGYKFQTVDEQLAALMPYAVGKFVNLLGDSDGENAVKGIFGNDFVKDNKNIINTWLGWQMPPGGFRADLQYIDSVQTGTLMLKLGPYYRLKNLIIQDIQLNYSKHSAKYIEKKGTSYDIKTCPLYCDVNITFSPASKYSNRMLEEFVMGRSSSNSTSIKSLEDDINSRLKS